MRIFRTGLLMLAVSLFSSGCGGPSGSSGSSGPEAIKTPPGVSVSVLQYRSDYTIRRIQIKVTNGGRVPVTVTAARLDSGAVGGEAAWLSRDRADETTIAPGSSTDLPAALPDTDCTAAAPFASTVRLDLRLQAGTVGRTPALPVGDPFGSITQVHADDCRKASALVVTGLALGPLRTQTRRGVLTGLLDLRLIPSGRPGTVTVQSIGSTTLLGPPTGDTWPVHRTVSAATGPQTVTLPLRPARCDPHAIAEDKLGTVLPLTLLVNGGKSGVVSLPADPDLRVQLQRFVQAACAPS